MCAAYLQRMHQGRTVSQQKHCDPLGFAGKPVGSSIYMNVILTHATYLNIVADHVYPIMLMIFHSGSGLFQQGDDPATLQKCPGMVQNF